MSEPEKPKFNPGATIQIELDQVQLVDPDAATGGDPAATRRTAPPPLPATAMPEVMASAATPAPRGSAVPSAAGRQTAQKDAKLALHLVTVIGVVVLAVVAGLVVAWRVRGSGSAPAASASPSAAPGTSASAPASSGVLTIPPIEVR